MSNQTILYFMAGTVALFLIVVIAYVILRKKMGKSEMRKMKELQEGTKEKKILIRRNLSKIVSNI